jgi:large subunit ribosomal protein L18
MVKNFDKKAQREKRHVRVRAKISGTPDRPRLNVYRSNANMYAQIIDDVNGVTLASASTVDKGFEGAGGNKEAAHKVGKMRSPSAPRQRASRTWSCSTAADTFITAACRLWLRAPARAA